MPVRVTRNVRSWSARLHVFLRRGRELGFAASTAEQHVLATMREPMRRIRFHNHAANGITQLGGLVVLVTMVGLSVHVVLASVLALLISLAPEPAPSHNGKVNTENLVMIP
jgi:hypothetical protein